MSHRVRTVGSHLLFSLAVVIVGFLALRTQGFELQRAPQAPVVAVTATPVPPSPTVHATAVGEHTPSPETTAQDQETGQAPPIASNDSFIYTFDGKPAAPQPWTPPDWDISVHSRDGATWKTLESVDAHHSAECGAPPATHTITAYEDMVFLCNDHVMTALNATDYGVIYLTPNQLVDFSNGEAVIRWDVSTHRSSPRDWIDVWISPFEENIQLPFEEGNDLQGPPKRGLHIRMSETGPNNEGTFLKAELINDHELIEVPRVMDTSYSEWLEPSAKRRDTFEIRLSRTHLKVWMPGYDQVWVDTEIPELDWTQGVVQFGHHSYNPTKCGETCTPNTWHWDNVEITPAIPFTMIRAQERGSDIDNPHPITFAQSAPANARLRFAGFGQKIELSFDGGATWEPAQKQTQVWDYEHHFYSYWTPIPEGVTSVLFRGEPIGNHGWDVRSLSIWAQTH